MKLILHDMVKVNGILENRFTGWKDVDLTSNGIKEANFAAEQIIKENLSISSIYTSAIN